MARLRDEYHRKCWACHREVGTPVHALQHAADGSANTACEHCGASHILQFRPGSAPPADLLERRQAIQNELVFEQTNLHIVRNRPKLVAEVQARIAGLERDLADLGPEAA